MHKKIKTYITPIITLILGALSSVFPWVEEDVMEKIPRLRYDIANKLFDHNRNNIFIEDAKWHKAETVCKLLVNLFYGLLLFVFIVMLLLSIIYFIRRFKSNLFISVIPFTITIIFLVMQTLMPFVNIHTLTTDGSYFPEDVFDEFSTEWYVEHLKALDEPSLYSFSTDENITVYRFLWLRTFHEPIAIRIHLDHNTKTGIVYFKVCDKDGFNPGKLIIDKSFNLNKKQYKEVDSLFFVRKFWHTRTAEIYNDGRDGARWIIEGVRGNKYHIVDRWTPEYGNTRKIGLYLLKLCGYESQSIY